MTVHPPTPASIEARPSWVDLIDVVPTERVLLLDASRGPAAAALRVLTPHVTVVGRGGGSDEVTDLSAHVTPGAWDLVVFDGVKVTDARLRRWLPGLAPGARVIAVGGNRASPLRTLDGLARGRAGPGARWNHAGTVRRLVGSGLVVHQVFGLLRSSVEPVVAFDICAASGMTSVIGATLAHVHGWRSTALSAAARAHPTHVIRLCPGWVVVSSTADRPADPDRVVGKVSNRDSEEIKLLRGDPVSSVERRYVAARSTGTANEAAALRELASAGFDLAPRLVGEPSIRSSHCSWLPGEPLAVDRLSSEDLVTWVTRAAEVLAELQDLTRHCDGTVLVHGDFWLGNLLTAAGRVTGVVDWTEARRGDPVVDQDFLVGSLDRWVGSPLLRRRLVQAVVDAVAPSC